MKVHTAVALAALLALGACGLKGGLEKPPPQFGDARRQYEAELRAKAEAAEKEKAAKDAERQTVTVPVQTPTSPVSPK
jgi:predicted small lipoprotein YifL